jgi:ribosomal protein L2
VQLHNVRDVTFAKMEENDTLFCYIIHDRRLDKMTCTCFEPGPVDEGRPSIRRAIDQAQRSYVAELKAKDEARVAAAILDGEDPNKAARDAKAEKEAATGAIIGIFEATYLGSTVVSELRGAEVVQSAVEIILKLKNVPQGVFVNVGTEGIKTIESLTHEVRVWRRKGGAQWPCNCSFGG